MIDQQGQEVVPPSQRPRRIHMGSLLQRRSKETLMDSAWRYRGLALLVSVPVRAAARMRLSSL